MVIEGDTRNTPYGTGSYSSRYSIVGTSSVTMAARTLGAKIWRIAAHLLETDPDDLELVDNEVRVKGDPSKKLTLQQISRTAYHASTTCLRERNPAWSLRTTIATRTSTSRPISTAA